MVLLAVKKEITRDTLKPENILMSGEAVAFCPHCKAFQTVWFNNNKLQPVRKFSQEGSQVYHDCGSRQPCRLYHSG